jgi:hypothetical protein
MLIPLSGVLLLDPTVDTGKSHLLWGSYRNWDPTPECPKSEPSQPAAGTAPGPPSDTSILVPGPELVNTAVQVKSIPSHLPFFDDFLYWAMRPDAFPSSSSRSNIHVPMQALLHLIGSEWLTMVDYVKTRLTQIDLEVTVPPKFANSNHVDIALRRLHQWRRLIPQYRAILSETLDRVFQFPCHIGKFPSTAIVAVIQLMELRFRPTTIPSPKLAQFANKRHQI